MYRDNIKKFLFKCDSCKTIMELEITESKDIDNLKEDKLLLECQCGGICFPLRN